jgi:dTDP-4-amino-4,6-dideoxygalactose transaminase
MIIPFYRPSITQGEINEVLDCLQSGWLTTGPRTKQFEQEFARYLDQKHSLALNSCTAALHLALEAVGLQAGDTVIVPTMTFAATAEVVRYFNATPLLVDCRESDFNLDTVDAEQRIEQAIARGEKITAILPVHYGGQIGDVAGVQALARRFNLKIIEDAAHCCPAYYREGEGPQSEIGGQRRAKLNPQLSTLNSTTSGWLPVGASAEITCFSFYANKCITTGEGGMACTRRDDYADRMRIMSLHGISKDAWKRFTSQGSWYYEIVAPGYKYNLTDIASAIGVHQLRRADELHRKRTQCAGLYSQLLSDVSELILPKQQPDRIHSWHLYAIRLRLDRLRINRTAVIDALKQAGITTSVHWMPLHQHPYYREKYGYRSEDLPVANRLYPELITLPLYPDMTEVEVKYVSDTLKNILAGSLRTEHRAHSEATK